MDNLTGLKNRHDEAVIIAMGPSQKFVVNNPGFCLNRSVAVVNRAGFDWPDSIDYWCTYHAEYIVQWWYHREALGLPMYKNMVAIVSKNKKNKIDMIPHINITKQVQGLNSGGTSSLMAAMALLGMGYKVVHLFGVDLKGNTWSKERKFWKILKGEPLVFHGDDWFHKGKFMEEKR